MNKTDMAQKVADTCDLSKAQAGDIIEAIFGTSKGIIANELTTGGTVAISGFGNFTAKERAARTGRNPATGETIQLAAKTYPNFKAGKGLKDRVAG
jgi:DNA-binding protein HU-beta